MRILRLVLSLAALQASNALACSCSPITESACSSLRGTEVVFVGRVIEDSGEGHGSGPARMVVEETLHGLSKDLREVTVDTSAGTSCYMRLKSNERYVIYGSRVPGSRDRITLNSCSFSFALTGNEKLLAALRQAEFGGPSRLVGKVQMRYEEYDVQGEGATGLTVVATSNKGQRLETLTNGDGEFEFLNIAPETYHLAVSSRDLFEDKWRFPSADPFVLPSGCGYQKLYVWPNGRIEGTIRSVDSKPLPGVPVQAFIKDRRRELCTSAVREAKTDENGSYILSGIPPGDVVVGVNGEKYHDGLPWAPTFFPGVSDRDRAKRFSLGRGQRLTGIDIQLPAPRKAATLHLEMVLENGSPALGAGASVENLAGIQRAFVSGDKTKNSVEVPVYIGETYHVKSFNFEVTAVGPTQEGKPVQSLIRSWQGESGPILVSGPDVDVRIVLREEVKK